MEGGRVGEGERHLTEKNDANRSDEGLKHKIGKSALSIDPL